MATAKKVKGAAITDLNRNWGWILGLGILFLILGCIGLSMAIGLTIVSMFFFGALLVIAGFMHILDVFKHGDWRGILWHAIIAVLYIAAGCVVFYDPLLASTLITALLASILIVIGITRLIMAITLKDTKGWGWIVLAGLTALVLGILILLQWPISGLWVIGMFIAIELLVSGWTYIFIALSLRSGK